LGKMAKNIGITNYPEVSSEIKAVSEIKPDDRAKGYAAKSEDYVVIMHYNEAFKDIMVGQFNEDTVEMGIY